MFGGSVARWMLRGRLFHAGGVIAAAPARPRSLPARPAWLAMDDARAAGPARQPHRSRARPQPGLVAPHYALGGTPRPAYPATTAPMAPRLIYTPLHHPPDSIPGACPSSVNFHLKGCTPCHLFIDMAELRMCTTDIY